MTVAAEAVEQQVEAIRQLRSALKRIHTLEPPAAMRAQWTASVRNQSRHWSNEIRVLEQARSFFWTHETTQAVSAVAPAFKLVETLCHRELLYCDAGFCWFERSPFAMQMRSDGSDDIRAISWAYATERQTGSGVLTLTAYGLRQGAPFPVTWAMVENGRSLNQFGAPSDLPTASSQELDRWQMQCEHAVRFLVAASTFLRQKLATPETVSLQRHGRKRLIAAGWTKDPLVSVVHLRERERRSASEADEDTSCKRSYACQWLVRAHTRQQWYPSLNAHLPVLIGPYIKGPEDKPLKPRSTPLFLVDR